MRITIRLATADDLPWLRHLVGKFMEEPVQANGYPTFDAEELDTFTLLAHRALTNPDVTFQAWLAWHGRTAVGCMGGGIGERLVGKPHRFAYGHWLYVEPKYRASGVGFRLGEAFLTWAHGLGVDMVETRAKAGDTQYDVQGYRPISTEYATEITGFLDRWRGHAFPPPAPPKANGHDTTAEVPEVTA